MVAVAVIVVVPVVVIVVVVGAVNDKRFKHEMLHYFSSETYLY